MTALCLVPLMTFAAFGVDLASWYSPQPATSRSPPTPPPWPAPCGCPTSRKSTRSPATASRERHRRPGDCGTGPFEVTVDRGTTATALARHVTDPNATRYFSQVISSGQQRLTREAEAEYNLPDPARQPAQLLRRRHHPDGSSRRRRTPYAAELAHRLQPTRRAPGRTAASCNVGTSSRPGLRSVDRHGTRQRTPTARRLQRVAPGATAASPSRAPDGTATGVPPPDYTAPSADQRAVQRVPTPRRHERPVGSRWTTGYDADVLAYTTRHRQPPVHVDEPRPRRIGAELRQRHQHPAGLGARRTGRAGSATRRPAAGGARRPRAATAPPARHGGLHTAGNRLCRWSAAITTITPPAPPNPIRPTRSPGFWAQVEGPGTIATNGDVYSTRCYTTVNCGSVQNQQYKDPDRPRPWLLVRGEGPGGLRRLDRHQRVRRVPQHERVHDHVLAGDRSFTSDSTFPTDFKVYQQTNPLDFSVRSEVFASSTGDEVDGSCNWRVNGATSTAFTGQWRRLCTITVAHPGGHLPHQRPVGGHHRRRRERLRPRGRHRREPHQPQPARPVRLRQHGHVQQQHLQPHALHPAAGHLLPGRGRPAVRRPHPRRRPLGPGRRLRRQRQHVPEDAVARRRRSRCRTCRPTSCTYTSSPAPNPVQSGGDPTGATYSTPQASDNGARCGITTATSGARRFNGTWVTIRIDIPADLRLRGQHAVHADQPRDDRQLLLVGHPVHLLGVLAGRHHLAGPHRGQPGPPHAVAGSRPGEAPR